MSMIRLALYSKSPHRSIHQRLLRTTTAAGSGGGGPITKALQQQIEDKTIRYDPSQFRIAKELDVLLEEIIIHSSRNKVSWRARIFQQLLVYAKTHRDYGPRMFERTTTNLSARNELQGRPQQLPRTILRWLLRALGEPHKGIYLHGSVGVGKSFLMDLFHEQLLLHQVSSQRVHFHEFMLTVHQRLKTASLPQVALEWSSSKNNNNIRVLCLDEFQVTDIADAMILKRLFESLWGWGLVVVATSNRPPDKLYEGGLNRSLFLPFVETLQEHCTVMTLDQSKDYRKEGLVAAGPLTKYFWPHDAPETQEQLNRILFGRNPNPQKPWVVQQRRIPVMMGRTIVVKTVDNNTIGRFHFRDLCENPLGASDYLALTQNFRVLVVEGIPRLDGNLYNEARRFVTFVDACYEARIELVLTADVPLEELFGTTTTLEEEPYYDGDEEIMNISSCGCSTIDVQAKGGSSSSHATTFVGSTEWSATGRIGASLAQLSSVKEVVFSFRRAESRLYELCR